MCDVILCVGMCWFVRLAWLFRLRVMVIVLFAFWCVVFVRVCYRCVLCVVFVCAFV